MFGFELAILICLKDLFSIRGKCITGPILREYGSSVLSSIAVNLDGELHPDGQNGQFRNLESELALPTILILLKYKILLVCTPQYTEG